MIKFALANEHYFHFEKEQLLELEGILTPLQIHQLKESIDRIMAHSKASSHDWKGPSVADRYFIEGRDLWRKDPVIRKLVTDRGLAKIASELLGGKFLRLAYDQLLPHISLKEKENHAIGAHSPYAHLLDKPVTLEEISCIQGILCGVCICLNSVQIKDRSKESQKSLFANHAGNVVFFAANKKIDFAEIQECPNQDFLLVVYAAKTALYVPNAADPHQHALKKLGYVFGDRLNDQDHPVLCRLPR